MTGCRGSRADWGAAHGEYLATLVRVCLRPRVILREQQDDILVLLIDDDHPEELIRAVLTEDEVQRHFPSFGRRDAEMEHVRALPPAGQAGYYSGRLDDPAAAEEAGSSLRALGQAAVPALLPSSPALAAVAGSEDPRRHRPRRRHRDPCASRRAHTPRGARPVVDRLRPVPAQPRTSRAGQAGDLPGDVVASAFAAPYTSFRDHAGRPLPLDYQPLADVLDHWPQYAPGLAERLRPGNGECTIGPGEVDEALCGLTSPRAIIRSHAVRVLGHRGLGPAAAPLVLPRLAEAAREAGTP